MIEYLAKYNYIFDVKLDTSISKFNTKYIWQCWLQGREHAPKIVQTCLNSIEAYQTNFKIKVLDKQKIHDYIEIPKHILDKFQKGLMSEAHFSDYIRVALLAKYGGTWIDSTVLLTSTVPSYILEQDFFTFKFPPWCNLASKPHLNIIFSEQTRNIDKRCLSNWLMHAKCGNRLVFLLKIFLEEYWAKEDKAFDYFMFHLFASYIILKDEKCWEIFVNMPELSNAYPHLLQQCLLQPYDANMFTNITKLTSIHKLMHKLPPNIATNSFTQHIYSLF